MKERCVMCGEPLTVYDERFAFDDMCVKCTHEKTFELNERIKKINVQSPEIEEGEPHKDKKNGRRRTERKS